MADYSNFRVQLTAPTPELALAIKEYIDQRFTAGCYFHEDVEDDSLDLGANEVRLGSVDELHTWLTVLVEDGWTHECPTCEGEKTVRVGDMNTLCTTCEGNGKVTEPVPDFPWQINDEPAYEYLGSIVFHTPGLTNFTGMCDADGTVIVDTGWLLKTVEDATDLEDLKTLVRKESALAHRAYRGWTG